MNKFGKLTLKQRALNLRNRVNRKIHDGYEWFLENKDFVVSITPFVVGGATTIFKIVGKRRNLRKEESLKDLYCYDRSLGHYWRLKRELTNKEWLEIDRRKNNGERLSDILAQMKVLK